MTSSSRNVLSSYIGSSLGLEVDTKFINDLLDVDPEVATQLFDNRSVSYGPVSIRQLTVSGEFLSFKRTKKESPREGLGVKPEDRKEKFVNGWGSDREDRQVYNRDPIPLCTYKKMGFDTKIKLASQLITAFVCRLQFEIVSSDPKKAAVVSHILSPIYNSLVRDMVDTSLRNGFMFAEKVWERRSIRVCDPVTKEVVYQGGCIVLSKVKTLDPENGFSFFVDPNTDELVRIEQARANERVSVPRKKVLWFALNKQYSNIFGTSAFRAAYEAWYYSQGLEQALLVKLDTTGEPIMVVRFPKGSNLLEGELVTNDVIAEEVGQKAQNSKLVYLPSQVDETGMQEWDITYLELKNSENDPYMKAIEYFDKKKVEALGIFGNIIAGSANFSELDAKEDLTLVMIEGLIDQIESCLQEDLVEWIVSYNFGPRHIDDVKIKIDRNSLGRSKMLQDLLKEMMRIAASEKSSRPKKMPSISRMAEALGVPLEDYSAGMDRSLLDEQIKSEQKLNKSSTSNSTGSSDPVDLIKQRQSIEDSNGRHRKTKDERERERPSSQDRE